LRITDWWKYEGLFWSPVEGYRRYQDSS